LKRSVCCDCRACSCWRDRGAKRFFFGSSSRRKEQTNRRASEQTRACTRARTHARTHVRTQKSNQKSSQIAPGGPRGDQRRFGRLRGRSRGAPGGARRALGAPLERLGTPPERDRTPRNDQKVRLGGTKSTFVSVLFGQSLARPSQSDFRTICGSVAEGATRNPIAMAHTDCMLGVFRPSAGSTTKSLEQWCENDPPIAPEVVSGDRSAPPRAPHRRDKARRAFEATKVERKLREASARRAS